MQLQEARNQFIAAWGSFGSHWGINRTMAQIHALLLVSAEPICTEDIMSSLSISRGNTNMNLRELINWGLVERVLLAGERKEFFSAEKDIWVVARIIARERKKRELAPMIKFLDSISDVQEGGSEKEIASFTTTINGIRRFSQLANNTIDTIAGADENWLVSTLLKIVKH